MTATEETGLAEYLIARVSDRARGSLDAECLRNFPRDTYFIGSLRPRTEAEGEPGNEPGYFRELLSKLAPVAFGAEFRVQSPIEVTQQIAIPVTVSWTVYYRVFPTFDQQRSHQPLSHNEAEANSESNGTSATSPSDSAEITDNENASDAEPTLDRTTDIDAISAEAAVVSLEAVESARDRRRSRTPQDSLFIRFRKIECSATGAVLVQRGPGKTWTADDRQLEEALDRETVRAQALAQADPERVQTQADHIDRVKVPDTALASEREYLTFLRTLQTDVVPAWHWQTLTTILDAQDDGSATLSVQFVNASPSQMPPDSWREHPNIEPYFFDTRAAFTFPPNVALPFVLSLAPRGFRYDPNLWGRGFNCAVERVPDNPTKFITTHTPIYRQARYVTREEPEVAFDDLAKDPVPVLTRVIEAMRAYLSKWDDQRAAYIAADSTWEQQFGAEFDRDRDVYEAEIARFERGCELIRTNADVRLAFELTNETFGRGSKTHWRLFQIVFLVGQIPGIAALANPIAADLAEREIVDIIYFPTGGGKTEAYLGAIVFHCFFDRLRGKSVGVTAWTRFPLRLLTLQQTQRYADVIGLAELIRLSSSDARLNGPGVAGFAVGYFVGEGGSPNEIADPAKVRGNGNSVIWSKANDEKIRQAWKRVVSCPGCGGDVRLDFDVDRSRLIHRCTNATCPFPDRTIPIYVVDNEIYRYLPAVIVGTIDKLAAIGNQRKLAQIFGKIDGFCTLHGYYKGKCSQKDCDERSRLRPTVPRGISGPTLFVQDELHLLKEGLGTFDGHYETFTQQLREEFGQTDTLKIIASSATIEAFKRQVEHLYGGSPRVACAFPGAGPSLGNSYYATTRDFPQRLYVGVIPHNKTIFNSILELIESYHREAQSLIHLAAGEPNPYGGQLAPGTSEWTLHVDNYVTSLTYFLANRELSSVHTDLEGDVNPNLQRDQCDPLAIYELTGNTGTDEVKRVLEIIERKTPTPDLSDTVLATSMVSHGVDVERLNAMIFYGMPRQTAEYIQASSRVGRRHVGIVFSVLHPARERDQSHYGYFVKYHQFLGQLVEPVAINRWATFSINRTLPGLFMGVLLQIIANRTGVGNPNSYYMLEFVRKEITSNRLSVADFVPTLEAAYEVVNPANPAEEGFRKTIQLRVAQFLDQIIGGGTSQPFVSEVLIPKPMNSLRDVDVAVEIELDNAGSAWATAASRQ